MGKDMKARREKKERNGWVGGVGHHTGKLSIGVSNSLGEGASTRRAGRRAAGSIGSECRDVQKGLRPKPELG